MIANLLPIPGLDRTSEAFRETLVRISSELGLDPSAMAAVMSLESGFNPAIQNSIGATGLIQFMPATALMLGTTTAELARMAAHEQLEFVKKYYEPFRGRIADEGDHYVATFMPALLGKPRTEVIAVKGQKVYDQNAGLDVTGDGILTVGDVKAKLERVTQTAQALIRKGGKPVVVEFPKASGPERRSSGPLFSGPGGSSSVRRPDPANGGAGVSAVAEASLRRRVARYFRDHPEGISPSQVRAWISTVRRGGGFTQDEADHVFRLMMAEGEIAVANGLFYSRAARRVDGQTAPDPDRLSVKPSSRQRDFWTHDTGPVPPEAG